MPRENLGEFEKLVMLSVLRCGGSAYGVPVVKEIQEQTERKASAAGVYIALRRLESKGYMESRMGDSVKERGGKARRIFSVTPEGKRTLLESRRIMQRMWQDLDVRIDES